MKGIMFPKLDPVPPLILPGSVEYERKHNPFRPSSRNAPIPTTSPIIKPISSTSKLNFENDKVKSPNSEHKHFFQKDSLDTLENIVCAQSHEPIKLTTSIWHPREGRLNIDKASILTMGSGFNDIRNLGEFETLEETQRYHSRLYISESMTNEQKSHDLTPSFIKTGPYNSINHKFWSAEINDVDNIPDEELDDSLETLMDQFDASETFLSKKLLKEQFLKNIVDHNQLTLERNNINNISKEKAMMNKESNFEKDPNRSLLSGDSKDIVEDLTCHNLKLTPPSSFKPITPPHNQIHGRKVDILPDKGKDSHHGIGRGRGNSRQSNKSGDKGKDKKKKGHDTSTKAKHSLIGSSIDTTNVVNWAAVEKKEFDFLTKTVLQMEKDKIVTHEKPFKGRNDKIGVEAAEIECRDVAKLKVRMLRGELLAIQDEEVREEKRKKDEDDNKKNKTKLKQLKETHESERHKFRTYLRTMKHDNEIVIAKRMNDNGFLW